MKRIISVFIAIVLTLSTTIAIAETIEIGSGNTVIGVDEYTALDNTLDIRPHAASVVEKLGEYGQDSGDKNSFVLINLDICNISFDEIDLNSIFSAELTYADRYVFSPEVAGMPVSIEDALLGKWEGSYKIEPERRTCSLEITEISSDGKFEGVWSFGPLDKKDQPVGSYSVTGVIDSNIGSITYHGLQWIIDPGNYKFNDNFYLRLLDNNMLCGTADESPIYLSKAETSNIDYSLNMLEEVVYPLVFLVPNRVASDIENCKVDIIVNGNHYQISLK